MRRPHPRRPASWKEREQQEEMRQQKIRASLVANFPQNRLCDACQARDPWIDICPQCRANAEAYADGRHS